jgi:hypothetical protein
MRRGYWRIPLRAVLVMLFVSGAFLLLAWHQPGRMTGGGSIFSDGMRITHGFELYCQVETPEGIFIPGPNNLEVNWPGHRFHLEELTSALCIKVEGFNPNPPPAPFTHFYGTGIGTLNGVPGATINFLFVDDGEPGTHDLARYRIDDANGTPVLGYTELTPLTFGNHQAHAANPKSNQ